ncbi:hypothetical protein Tco_0669828 [Tanacetum coccineum]
MQWIIHKGWLEWSAKAAKDEIEVKTGNSKVNAAGHYLVLLGENGVKVQENQKAHEEFSVLVDPAYPPCRADETVHEERGDSMERAATTAASLDAEQDSGNIIRTQSMATLNEPIPQGTGSGSGPRRQDTILGDRPAQTRFERLSKQSNDPPLSGVNTPGSGEDRLKIMELMEICTKLSDRVLALENVKTAQDLEITNEVFQSQDSSHSDDKSLGDQEDASKQGRNIAESDQDEGISFVQEDAETQGRYDHEFNVTTVSAPITTTGISISTAEPSTPPTTTTVIEDKDLIIAQTLMKMRSEKLKEKAKEGGSKENSSEPATRPTKGVTMQEPIERKQLVRKAGEELDEESVKRQKLEDDAEKAELQLCLEIVPRDDEAVNVESLATKYPM